jgi:hypothetical protein
MDMAKDEINLSELKRLCVCLNWLTFMEVKAEKGTPGKADLDRMPHCMQPYAGL